MASNCVKNKFQTLCSEDVVISGMAGKFPQSANVDQFRDNLFNKVNLITEGNHPWKSDKMDSPQKIGRLKDVFAFDAGFFGIRKRLGNHMDVYHKLLLENAYEVILDAGYQPSELVGTNTGVFIGASLADAEYCILYGTQVADSHSMIGATRSLVAQQISYFFHLQGPSYTNDCGCSTAMYALEHAYRSIKKGICDMAIVGGANLILLPEMTLDFKRLGVLSKDGRCKSFDKSADGYVRAETISTLFLQKSKNARRVYAHLVHCKLNNDGYKERSMIYPSSYMQTILMKEVYNEGNVDLRDVSFLEAHGTGTKVGDREELTAISNVFCSQRNNALYIGSVKSNAGHTEFGAALVSVIKVLIGMECGFIPPNMYYLEPRDDVSALITGQLKVVTEKMLWPNVDAIAGINSFGFGGSNGHLILRWNEKVKVNLSKPQDDLPRLVCASGRTADAVDTIWNYLSSRSLDIELINLLHNIFRKSILNHPFRGYQILCKVGYVKRSTNEVNGSKNKLAWVFSNFESNWPRLGRHLMAFPVFKETLETIQRKTIRKLNLDIVSLFAKCTDETKVNHQILATTTMQICLVEVLKGVGITPDSVIGLGTGELTAAYFEGHITLNDIIQALPLLDDENCIISEGAKFTSGSNAYLKNWLTSALRKQTALSSKINAPEMIGSHRPEKVLSSDNEILVIGAEIQEFEHLSLIRANSQDCVLDLLTTLGRLYENGHDLNLCNLYPKVTWPVSRGTPTISPLVKWNHDQNYDVTFSEPIRKRRQRIIHVDLETQDWKFFNGHVIDEKNIFPPAAYIFLVWETLAIVKRKSLSQTKVTFEEINFVEVINLENHDNVKLVISILEASSVFEITRGDATIVTGKVREVLDTQQVFADLSEPIVDGYDDITLTQVEIYRELKLRGYNYKGQFKSIETIVGKKKGLIKWTRNYTTFLDSLLQVLILHLDTRNLYLPISITQLIIDPVKHMEVIDDTKEQSLISIDLHYDLGIIRAGGIELRGLKGIFVARQKSLAPVLERHIFIPNVTSLSLVESIRVLIQIITENSRVTRFRSAELPGESQLISPLILQLVDGLPQIQAEVIVFSKNPLDQSGVTFENGNLKQKENLLLVILTRAFETKEMLQDGLEAVKRTNGYVLTRELLNFNFSADNHQELYVLCVHSTESEKIVLLRASREYKQPIAINVTNDLKWLPEAQGVIKRADPLVLYSQNQLTSGIMGLVNCLRREPHGDCVSCFFIIDDAPVFDSNHPFYQKQIRKRMIFKVWKEGKWGSYRHLLLEENAIARCSFCYANATVPRDLNSIKFTERNKYDLLELNSGSHAIYVCWASLTVGDVLTAIGRIPVDVIGKNFATRENVLGLEFSGRDSTGTRVMGLTTSGALATQTVARSSMTWTVPDEWSLEDAATVPGAYLPVLYALLMKVKIKCGQCILIHFGDGTVSQAAINIAFHFGCIIFVAVDKQEEMLFLLENYPQIEENHVGYSRDASFEETVILATKGLGVDIVLNSRVPKGSAVPVRFMARQEIFFEIGHYDLKTNAELEGRLFHHGINFHSVILESLITNESLSGRLSKHFSDLLRQGAIKPISRIVFKMEKVADAFELMATSKYIGKVLVNIRKDEEYLACTLKSEHFTALPRFHCDPKGTYIIIGGLGGFGLQLANWLVSRGAKKLVLNSRTGLKTGYQAVMLKLWQSYHAHVSLRTSDVTVKEGCTELIAHANSLGQVKAIFNLATVLKDALFEDQTAESFKVSLAPKAIATQYLDTISRIMCPELKYFVVFSSGSCARGNAMQSNYGFANSIMERICEKRKINGFPALAIQWGLINDVGTIEAFHEKTDKEIIIAGTSPQRICSCLHVLEKLLRQDETIVSSVIVAQKTVHSGSNVLSSLLNILGIRDLAKVNQHLRLVECGMNSLINAQIKQVLETEFEVFLSSEEINAMTLANLQDMAKNHTWSS